MKNFLSSLLATIVGILIMTIVVVLIFVGIIAASTSKETPEVKENSLLIAKFNSPIIDRSDENPFSRIMSVNPCMSDAMGLNQILKDLKKAKTDENIKGIVLQLSSVPAGRAAIEEVRNALLDFKETGKFIYAYADMMTQRTYYLATAADSIFMTPEGILQFTGLSAEVVFYKKAMEKLGIEVQVIRHGSYKSANERFMRENLSDENREQIGDYFASVWDRMMAGISESRGIPVEKLNQYADEVISFDNNNLVESGMIDGLIYFDEMLSLLKDKMGVDEKDDLSSIRLTRYADVPVKEKKEYSRDKIAVIYAMGNVVDGNAGEGSIGSERIAKAIRKARRDKSVKAIVLRVNSGGGSMIASDVIHREVKLAAEAKPLVASMGNMAASGGYYIVAPADTIVASPSTLTGSIGVYSMIPNTQKLMNEKLGITTDVVKTNRHADMFTVFNPLDPAVTALLQKSVDEAYDTFLSIVSDGRDMTKESVDALGGGRIWSGSDALDNGLIDMIGGLEKSIEVAAGMADLENYRVQSLPRLDDPLTMIIKELTGDVRLRIIQKELGNQYKHYKNIQEIKEMQGIQALMPFYMDIH
ncbi:MAG: signal peptide peptidase SppA [Bacteroidales bacterium]|nr:signal peptide peptidase SppA [Bacteroidales bacterium]